MASGYNPATGQDSSGEESHSDRVNRELIELLNELRVALPGVQVLFAFLLAVPFAQGFAQTNDFQRDLFFGTLLAAAWPVGLAAGATWLAAAFLFRISSLGALTAALLAPVYALLLGRPVIAALAAFMAVLIYIRHAANIRRLLKGEEPRIGAKKTEGSSGAA